MPFAAFGVTLFVAKFFFWSSAVFLIYAIPPSQLLNVIGYCLVAENCHRISRWFGTLACLIKQSDH
jgi:hypothetical protein